MITKLGFIANCTVWSSLNNLQKWIDLVLSQLFVSLVVSKGKQVLKQSAVLTFYNVQYYDIKTCVRTFLVVKFYSDQL